MHACFLIAASLAAVAGTPTSDIPAAAAHLPEGVHVHLETEVDASTDASWAMLAHEYVGVSDWTTTVKNSWVMTPSDVPEGVAADADAPVIGRMVKSKLGVISETLVNYDEAGKTFTFRAGGLPSIIAYSQSTQQVVDLGDGRSKITWDIYMVPNVPPTMHKRLEKRFQRKLGAVLEEARVRIEADGGR